MEDLLKKMIELMSKVELSSEQLEKNMVSRYVEPQEKVMKSVRDATPVNNDFSKNKAPRKQATQGDRGDRRYGDKFEKGRYPDRERRYRDERPGGGDEWRVEEDE